MDWLKVKATDVILGLSMFILAVAVVLLVTYKRYDSAVAISAVMASIIIPFCTKNLELEKHRRQFLFEKKYEAYKKYFNLFDSFWKVSRDVVISIEFMNRGIENKEDFEQQKQIFLVAFAKFTEIRDYLSMPGLEILVFINKEIENKIKEIIELDTKKEFLLDTEADLITNAKKIEKYIDVLSKLATLLQEDLGIEVK